MVIGNPPYIRIQALKEWAPKEVEFYKQRYTAASKGNYDIYVVFVEKAISLLNLQGWLGFILPSKFFATDYGEKLREFISIRQALQRIVDFGHLQIFDRATTYTCLLFLSGTPRTTIQYTRIESLEEFKKKLEFREIPAMLGGLPWMFSDEVSLALAQKITKESKSLGELPARIGRGSSSGADNIFIIQQGNNGYLSRQGNVIDIEDGILRKPIYATDFGRYKFEPDSNELIIFPYRVESGTYQLIPEDEFQRNYPNAYKYLLSNKKSLEERKQYKKWYSFSAPRNLDIHERAHILIPLLADHGMFCRIVGDSSGYCLMASGGFSITIHPGIKLTPNYVLGLLNSRLIFWQLRRISNMFRGGWITCTKQYVETLPIRMINLSNPPDVIKHDQISTYVENMITLNTQLSLAQTPTERTILQRQIDATDHEIDRLVYELYELSEEEIRIVEGK